MTITDSLRRADIATRQISFEFFPPKTETGEKQLWSTIEHLRRFDPTFVSVTYGAGGSTRDGTHQIVSALAKEGALRPAAHLTCVGATRDEVDAVVEGFAHAGIQHIVALRGDSPAEEPRYKPHPQGYRNAADLVSGIAKRGNFEISVAAYPERHPDSPDWAHEIDNLKQKADAGATRAITQFFFDNDLFEDFLERVRAAGITIPVVPGLLPIYRFAQAQNFAARCGAGIPPWLVRTFAGLEEDLETQRLISTALLADQVFDLMARGVEDFHFYTLNRFEIVAAVCHLIKAGKQG